MSDIEALRLGFKRFYLGYFQEHKELFERLAREGQAPRTLIISCSDSRADPVLITGAKPGDLFVIRNVANLVPPCEKDGHFHGTSAGIEFAVCNLGVRNIIVMGHARCGGIRALLERYGENNEGEGFIAPWVSLAHQARERVLKRWPDANPEFQQRACERAAILISLENLMTFPFVQRRVEAGELKLFGWYFDIESGELMEYDPASRRFYDLVFD
ncbi:MAG TPA: carbonic anhydrase [Candidatus Competibacteraceae bacterium]|nr:carbonic anhydrase [Candidatus Competibacteraceae bacterium]